MLGLRFIAGIGLALAAAACSASSRAPVEGAGAAWVPGEGAWRDDEAWHDGLAEKCVYEAVRTIYGRPREYLATAYTNKERYDARTTTKSDGGGIEVFKHHWSERAPTENYDYDFSTSIYARADSLAALKLTVGTQEDCGASFKQAWRDGEAMRWLESVYFPGTGLREGEIAGAAGIHFADALPLVLRDFPFDAPRTLELALVPSQKDVRRVPFEPIVATVTYVGREALDLPIGRVDAHHLNVSGRGLACELWFHADGSTPNLHALVQYRDDRGTSYRLRSLERTAYWKR